MSNEKALPFGLVPVEVCYDSRLSLRQMRVLIALFSCRNRSTNLINPKRERLAMLTGLRVDRITEVTSDLVKLGWLVKVGNGGRSSPNHYQITTPEHLTEALCHATNKTKEPAITPPDLVSYEETPPETGSKNPPDLGGKTHPEKGGGKEQTIEQTKEQKRKVPKEKNDSEAKSRSAKPGILEITEFIRLKNYAVDAVVFFNHYESNGWVVGKARMRCWKAALANWNARETKQRESKHGKYRASYDAIVSSDW